jgi:regulator of protease activity HflC (stomatin/prohibitin superfamily)
MPELIRALAELLQSLWPLRSVWQWQRGVYYVCGRYWRTVGPGVWPVIPWFVDVRPVNVAPAIHHTALQTVTLRDGRTLVFSATITSEVEDAAAAYNRVDRWGEAVVELVAGLLSERLADADPARFDPSPGGRGALVEELRAEADAATAAFGVRVRALRFGNFAVGVRAYRLMGDVATLKG